jgi:uncharacterized protein YcfJ
MKRIAALAATALTLLGAAANATPSAAQGYPGYGYGYAEPCAEQQHDSGTAGALLGGLAGALLGSSVAPHHGNRAGGAAIGAVAGAVIGNNIARSDARSSDVCQARDYGEAVYREPAPYPAYAPYGGAYYRSGYQPYRYEGYDPYSY